jgi:hypothetical protein
MNQVAKRKIKNPFMKQRLANKNARNRNESRDKKKKKKVFH